MIRPGEEGAAWQQSVWLPVSVTQDYRPAMRDLARNLRRSVTVKRISLDQMRRVAVKGS